MKIVIIGGGAAGFMAAITCAEANPAAKVLVLERGKEVLQKVKISGGGRCNVTHACFVPKELVKHYPRGEKELIGPFHRFCSGDMLDWLDKRQVATKIEDDGRIFPTTDSSQTIIDCLLQHVRKAGAKVLTGQRVERLQQQNEQWLVFTKKETFQADKLLVATGSNPSMWKLLEELGHEVVPPVPSLFTFNIKDERIRDLPGLSVPKATVKVLGTKLEASGPLLITHWGMSGPAILKLSAWGARELYELGYKFDIQVNWLGANSSEDLRDILLDYKSAFAKKQIFSHPQFGLPQRLWKTFVQAAKIPSDLRWADLNKKQLNRLVTELTQGQFKVNGKSTFKEEFVTAGGVELKEVDFKTFASKKRPNLYFAGEVLNIDAITGGFNFQAAWTGGWIAGHAMAGIDV